ncbi:glycosyltransferase involved in cell wall biosynthesis [Geothermobacter ehrlichii]|uniref:Glycosyltransferase involved in cell wall biosynthesis n=1 Tax=Geothermobacter ehrlichii TaxID=213224 RepID=A0A5D3WFZ5_9BACT|nr:glycosyltransferase family 2 protein [Geothermobacter ehrlichii]TYO96060.1 glycosyltransferase involved in cell wall biosynthesis [Geothermobacter ehrlichii]
MISIITITYNSEKFIEQTIKSVLSQDYPCFEYIIVDGLSSDRTLDIVRNYARLDHRIKWISEPDRGISDAMNKGISLATGEVVSHLHSDDTYLPGTLGVVSGFFQRNPEAKWLTGCLRYVDENGKVLYDGTLRNDYSLDSLLCRNIISHPATFIKRDVFAEVGYFSDKCRYAMDYDLWLRIAAKYPVSAINKVLATFRVHSQSLSTSDILEAISEDFKIRRKYRKIYGQTYYISDSCRFIKDYLIALFGLSNYLKIFRSYLKNIIA